MTVSQSLDAYLEPTRLSFSSPPVSEIMPQTHSSDESYPVFSPSPSSRKQSFSSTLIVVPATTTTSVATTNVTTASNNTLQPGSFVRQHRRQSSVNTVSWTDQGEVSSGRIRQVSTILDPSHETDEGEVTLRRKPGHRRQSSMGISFYRNEEHQTTHRRRYSYASSSWIRDADDEYDGDDISTRTGRSRPCSWGPVGDFFYRDSLSFFESERSSFSHQECNFIISFPIRNLFNVAFQIRNCIILHRKISVFSLAERSL